VERDGGLLKMNGYHFGPSVKNSIPFAVTRKRRARTALLAPSS
jgi:hypothetical protein